MQKADSIHPILLRDIAAAYEAKREANYAEEIVREEAARAASPAIGRLLDERVTLFHKEAEKAFANPEKANQIAKKLQKKITDLQSELRRLLVRSGFSEDYLQPVYQCPNCHDTGYVGDPVRERCTCFTALLQRLMIEEAGGHGLLVSETFEGYDETVYTVASMPQDKFAPMQQKIEGDSQRSYMARLRDLCLDYAQNFPNNARRNLLFLGKSGLGKTYLMNCIGNFVRAKGVQVQKLTAYQLTERMRKMVFDHEPEAMAALLTVPLLLLDDLGVEPIISNITIEQLFALLNERELRGLHTVISSNLHADELKQRYTERVTSRLYDRRTTATLIFKGDDVRLRR